LQLYHSYDRVGAQSHNEWPKQQPHLIWTSSRTIVDYLGAGQRDGAQLAGSHVLKARWLFGARFK
jgi:hypothetical protein